ncbi:Hypothetical predicted protein [Xyrichtys novacula]|uniref:Uncharacterized protein n=1 Tax=Xyrichtys novacula TaxID=13765 RepID=A0AAV1F978_XYRNO|nr:Hypothetical predicted protein [Xyrichtys novacula]
MPATADVITFRSSVLLHCSFKISLRPHLLLPLTPVMLSTQTLITAHSKSTPTGQKSKPYLALKLHSELNWALLLVLNKSAQQNTVLSEEPTNCLQDRTTTYIVLKRVFYIV